MLNSFQHPSIIRTGGAFGVMDLETPAFAGAGKFRVTKRGAAAPPSDTPSRSAQLVALLLERCELLLQLGDFQG